MSAEAMSHGLLAALNRPEGWLAAKLRIADPVSAYAACCVASTAIVAALYGSLLLLLAGLRAEWTIVGLENFIRAGLTTWAWITLVGAVFALPFVPLATLIGARLKVESLAYYAGLGGIITAALAFLLFGLPRPSLFGTSMFAWTVGPACGAAFGAAWWYLHRRWKSSSR